MFRDVINDVPGLAGFQFLLNLLLFIRSLVHKPGSGVSGAGYHQKSKKKHWASPFQTHVSTPLRFQNTIKFWFGKTPRFPTGILLTKVFYQAFSKIDHLQQ